MKETRFIAQNKEKWLESENLLTQERKEPEKLSNLFTQVIDDLSYSRTYYPNRSIRVYLNKIAREYFSIIYSRPRDRKNAFRLFWFDELPQIVIHCRRELIVSFLFFSLSMAIGVFSSMKDPQFTSSILGDGYVAMTKANIEKGDPMAVYKSGNEVNMFLGITLNNLMVAFRTYVFGIFLSIGSLAILMYNGIMVGCFQYFFIERGLFAESALTIWLHGTLEISSVILAGGAGITLGSGLVFPGTYSRLQAFQLSGIRSLKLMLGISPIFVFAAIIESFLTRYTEVPDFIRLLLILISLSFIVGYFVIYPWWKSRKGFEVPIKEVRLAPSVDEPVNYQAIKNNADLLKDAFVFYKNNFSKIFPWILGAAMVVTTGRWLLLRDLVQFRSAGQWWVNLFGELLFGMGTPNVFFIGINALANSVVLYAVYRMVAGDAMKGKQPFHLVSFLSVFLVMAVVYGLLYALGAWGVLILLFTFVCFLLGAFAPFAQPGGFAGGIGKAWNLLGANYSQVFLLHLILLLITFSFLIILSAPLVYMYLSVFKWNFAKTDTWINDVLYFFELFIKVLSFYMTLPILAACSAYLYYSLSEIMDAPYLRQSIEVFGAEKQKYGRR
ncbi:MAG TPA: stage II sporulation protein M [Cyclobacteriaceae bacterium]|nr:stage II sporulation protein M [Cyclobacteriaceae bacterium]